MRLIAFFNFIFGIIVIGLLWNLYRRSKMQMNGADPTKKEGITMLVCFVGYIVTGFMDAFYILLNLV